MLISRLFIADRRLVNPQPHQRNGIKLSTTIGNFCERGPLTTSCPPDFRFRAHFESFQDIGHAIRAGDPRINRIDVSKPNFLAQDDLPPIRLPVQQIPPQLVVPLQQVPLQVSVEAEEEIASYRLSLKEEIDQFRFAKDAGPSVKPVDISDSETDSVDISSVHPKQLVITQIDSEFEEEEDQMDQKKRLGLRGLLAKNKGGSSKEAPKTQPLPEIPLPPPPTDLGL